MKLDSKTESIRNYLCPIYPDGWMFIAIFAVGSMILGALSSLLLYVGLLATGWCIYFFRDPRRVVPQGKGLIIAAADGKVDAIAVGAPPAELGLGNAEYTRISVMLTLMDVHVNRIPIAGTVTALKYHQGAFLNASLDKAHEENERQYIGITTESGTAIGVVQIAGLISRRIVCKVKENQKVSTGERFGIIRFGSRVDVYIPAHITPLVMLGQRVVAGETILADLEQQTTATVREGSEV